MTESERRCKHCGRALEEGNPFEFCNSACSLLFRVDQNETSSAQSDVLIEAEEKKELKEKKKGLDIDKTLESIPIKGTKVGDYVSLVCSICGNKFERSLKDIKNAKSKGCKFIYCSEGCSSEGQQGTFISQNERQRWKVFAEKIKEKYGDICEICGWPEREWEDDFQRPTDSAGKERRFCDGHHILEKSEGGPIFDERNVIIVCPNHHRFADRKLYTPQQLFDIIRPVRAK